MVKVYAVSLAAGVVGLVILVLGDAISSERAEGDGATRFGPGTKQLVAGLTAFGMGGLAAEFAPLDFDWPLALVLALAAGAGGVLWARYATRPAPEG